MWETTVMHKQVSGWTVNFGSKFWECPTLRTVDYPQPNPLPPHPRKLKFSQISALWVLTWLRVPPPLKIEIQADLVTLSFDLAESTPPPSKNWNLGRSWHFEFWLGWEYPHPPSDLGWAKFTLEYPPPVKIVRESKSESFRMPRVTTCGDFIQPG